MWMIRRFIKLLNPHYKQGLILSMLLLLSTVITVLTPFFYQQLVDDGVLKGDAGTLSIMIAVIAAAMLAQEGLKLIRVSLTLNIRRSVFAKLRADIFSRFMKMPQRFHHEWETGRMISRMTWDVDEIENLMLEKFIYFIQNLLTALFICIVILFLDWKMLAYASLFLPLLYVLYIVFRKKIFSLSKVVQEKQEDMMVRIHEDLAMVKAIQSFSIEANSTAKTATAMSETENAKNKLSMTYSQATSSTIAINVIGLLIIWGVGGMNVMENRMTLGTLIAISFYLSYMINLFYSAYYTVMGFHHSMPAAQRIFDILDLQTPIHDRAGAIELPEIQKGIAFKQVGFSYGPDTAPVFSDVNFQLCRGELVGIVGESGQGKTTLANLFMRLFDPDLGTIEYDGHDIRTFKLDSLRKQVALVPQEDYMFHRSVRDNILLDREGISEDQFHRACRLANVDKFVASFESGYDTPVGQNGMKLSAGQKKRIAIARALAENPSVLIFDESTSVLDEETEQDILNAIRTLAKDKIILLITHKISNLTTADQILHVGGGNVTSFGGYEDYRQKLVSQIG